MDYQALTGAALEAAYKSQIGKMFSIYLDAIVISEDQAEEAQAASDRFKTGLQVTQKASKEAMEIAGIES